MRALPFGCTHLLGVVLMYSQWSLFHNVLGFFLPPPPPPILVKFWSYVGLLISQVHKCSSISVYQTRGGGGGGTSILKVSRTCRWTGYDFAIIAIKTGCLNQPNHWHRVSKSAYLATGTDYSVYHRVAFSAHNVYDRSAISAPTRRVGACGTSIPTIL